MENQHLIYFRLIERGVMTAVVLLIALTVMIAFWRSVQKIDFSGVNPLPDLRVGLLLNTPVFVLLALMGYAYVVLNAKISLDQGGDFIGSVASDPKPNSTPRDGAGGTGHNAVDNSALERNERLIALEALNCLAANDKPMPEDLQDALIDAKLFLLKPVWSSDWQPFDAFATQMRLADLDGADPETLRMFNRRLFKCPASSSP